MKKKKSKLIEREKTSKGEANWPSPGELTTLALSEICDEFHIPKAKRPAFCQDLVSIRNDLKGLILDMKQRGANSKHRDDWEKHLKNLNLLIRQLEALVEYERGRQGRDYLDPPVVPLLSEVAAQFLPALFDPRLLLPIEGSTPPHLGEMNRPAHMNWLRQFGAVHHAAAWLPVYQTIRDSVELLVKEMRLLTISSRRPQNILGPTLVRTFRKFGLKYLPAGSVDDGVHGPVSRMLQAFCHHTGLPTSWISGHFKKAKPGANSR